MMKHDSGPNRPPPRADVVQVLTRLGIGVIDPDLDGWRVLGKISERCHLRIDDERHGDPRDREHAGLCMNFLALKLPEADRRAYAMNLSEAMKFAGLTEPPPRDFPNLATCERALKSLCEPLDKRLQQFDSASPKDLLEALRKNRFGR